MGVTHWLIRIDPEKWEKVCNRMSKSPPRSQPEAKAFLMEFARDPHQDLYLEEFVLEKPDSLPQLLNFLLEKSVTEESWDLDKSIAWEYIELTELIPPLSSLSKIFQFRGIDYKPPKNCLDKENSFFGAISSSNLSDCLAAVNEFDSMCKITATLRQIRPSFVARLFGRRRHILELAKNLDSDYYSLHWANIRNAIVETTKRQHLLGIGMNF